MYRLTVYIHIVSAIASIGPFFLLLPLIKKMRATTSTQLTPYLTTFKTAINVVKHAGHVLVISGALLIFYGPWSWFTSWVLATLITLLASSIFLARAFSPTFRKFEHGQMSQARLISELHRSLWIYLLLLLLMLWFMVDKPTIPFL